MRIRRAHENEAALLSSLAVAAKRHWNYSNDQIEAWRPDLEISAATVASHPTYVAEHQGDIAGFYSLTATGDDWELDHLWVRPEFNRMGFGRALLEHAVLMAGEGGATTIAIDADPNAELFYSACGAQRVGTVAAPIAGEPARIRPQLRLPVLGQRLPTNMTLR